MALVLAALAGPAPGQTLAGRGARVLFVSQSVAGPADRAASQLRGRVGSATASRAAEADRPPLALDGAERDPVALGVAGIAARDYGTGTATATIRQDAAARVAGQRAALRAQLDRALAATGAQLAYFTYTQEVVPAEFELAGPAAGTARITWMTVRDRRGVETATAARLRTDLPRYLWASYLPGRVARDLPAELAGAGGTLRIDLVDAGFRLIASLGVLDTGGAFDAGDPDDGLGHDPEQGVRCLADRRHAGCAAGLPDLRDTLLAHAADAAVLDYAHALRLARQAGPGEAPAATVLQPLAGVRIDRRSLLDNGCATDAVIYRNEGQRGFVVEAEATRYLVAGPAEEPAWPLPLGRAVRRALAAPQPYEKSRHLSRAEALALGDAILQPLGDGLELVAADQVPGLLAVPPLTATGPTRVLLQVDTAQAPLLADANGTLPAAAVWRNTILCPGDGRLWYVAEGRDARAPAPRFERGLSWLEYRAACAQVARC